jgi:hypothetical protein
MRQRDVQDGSIGEGILGALVQGNRHGAPEHRSGVPQSFHFGVLLVDRAGPFAGPIPWTAVDGLARSGSSGPLPAQVQQRHVAIQRETHEPGIAPGAIDRASCLKALRETSGSLTGRIEDSPILDVRGRLVMVEPGCAQWPISAEPLPRRRTISTGEIDPPQLRSRWKDLELGVPERWEPWRRVWKLRHQVLEVPGHFARPFGVSPRTQPIEGRNRLVTDLEVRIRIPQPR